MLNKSQFLDLHPKLGNQIANRKQTVTTKQQRKEKKNTGKEKKTDMHGN